MKPLNPNKMKPLTAEDLVIGGKYLWKGELLEYKYHSLEHFLFTNLSRSGSVYGLKESDFVNITPYTEPNQTTKNMSYDEQRISDQIDGGLLKLAEQDEQNYTEQPFNLETALKHPEWVYFRNGEKPLEWHWFEKAAEDNFPLIAINQSGGKISNTNHGFFDISELPNDHDLILRVPYREVNVYLCENGSAFWIDSEKNQNYHTESKVIATVPVKIPAND